MMTPCQMWGSDFAGMWRLSPLEAFSLPLTCLFVGWDLINGRVGYALVGIFLYILTRFLFIGLPMLLWELSPQVYPDCDRLLLLIKEPYLLLLLCPGLLGCLPTVCRVLNERDY